MPDLFTHFSSAYLPSSHPRLRRFQPLLVVGVVVPDLFSRVPEIVLDRFLGMEIGAFFNALHTPVGFGAVCYLLALLFPQEDRKSAFFLLLAGAFLHFIPDVLQSQFNGGKYRPFFPFSFLTVEGGLFHYNDSLFLFPILFPLVAMRAIGRSSV